MKDRGARLRLHRRWRRLGAAVATVPTVVALGTITTAADAAVTPHASSTVTLIAENAESGDTGLVSVFQEAATAFDKSHPGVNVVMRAQTFDAMQDTGVLELSDSNPPSVYQVNQGWISIARLATDHLLLPLTTYAAQYQWDQRQSSNLLAYDGEAEAGRLGEGTLYGISVDADAIGLWYNKALLAKLHQPVPTTFTQFTNDLALAKQAQITPLTLGVAAGGDADFHVLMDIMYSEAPQSQLPYLRNLVEGNPPATWDSPSFTSALKTLQDWANSGYFTPGYAGLSLDAAISDFTSGKALFFVGGNYYSGQIIPEMGSNVGFAPPPSGSATHGPVAEASGGLAWTIPTNSPNHALAAEFINYLTGPQVARMFLDTQQFPILQVPDESAIVHGTLGQVAINSSYLLQASRAMPWLSLNTPDSFNKIVADLSALLADRMTPAAVGADLQADELTFRATQKS